MLIATSSQDYYAFMFSTISLKVKTRQIGVFLGYSYLRKSSNLFTFSYNLTHENLSYYFLEFIKKIFDKTIKNKT